MSLWSAPLANGPVRATVSLPGSKSITNRALVLAAIADGPSTITGALRSRDTDLMIDALRALGATVSEIAGDPSTVAVTPCTMHGAEVDCGLAGTVMRFLPPVAALAIGEVNFDGDEQARARPLDVILDALRAVGVQVHGDGLPFTISAAGSVDGGTVTIDASGSSQFVSGLLLSAARFERGLTVHHLGKPLPSMPHIEMTVQMLREAGVVVEAGSGSAATEPSTWRVAPGPVRAVDWTIEPDLSNATPFLAAAAVTAGTVRVPNWPLVTTQPGDAIRSILEQMGAEVTFEDESGGSATLRVTGPGRLHGLDIDLHDVGELTPTVAALAAVAEGTSRLRGIAHLRGHETDRLAALSAEIGARGGSAEESADGLTITPAVLHGGTWHSYADHRMATAGAILGLVVPGVRVEDIDTTAKTLPGFDAMWTGMLAASREPGH